MSKNVFLKAITYREEILIWETFFEGSNVELYLEV